MSVKVKCLLNTNGKTFVFSSYAFSLCCLEIMFVFLMFLFSFACTGLCCCAGSFSGCEEQAALWPRCTGHCGGFPVVEHSWAPAQQL